MHALHSTPQRRMGGIALIEPLVAIIITGAGLLAVAKFQANLIEGGGQGRQRAEALHLAQDKLEALRATAYDSIADGSDTAASQTVKNATYSRSWDETTTSNYKTVTVMVNWTDQNNTAQSLALAGIISSHDPSGSGVIISETFTPGSNLRTPFERGITIPVPAVDNGDGTSSYTPPGTSGVHIVYDNASGEVQSFTDAGTTYPLTPPGHTISGYVSRASNPDEPNSPLLSSRVYLTTTAGTGQAWDDASNVWRSSGDSLCWSDSIALATVTANATTDRILWTGHGLSDGLTVQFSSTGTLPGGIGAGTVYYVRNKTANDFQLSTSATGSTQDITSGGSGTHSIYEVAFPGYITYTCLVASSTTAWRGSSKMLVNGYSVGTGSSETRICRYYATSGDSNGNSTVEADEDANGNGLYDGNERPYPYPLVSGNLSNQNYYLLKGNRNCPDDGPDSGSAADVPPWTVRHQPF